MCNVNRVSTSNPFDPLKVDIHPRMFDETEDDSDWPKIKRQPVNNKPGPKKINLDRALTEPRKERSWKVLEMVDRTKP